MTFRSKRWGLRHLHYLVTAAEQGTISNAAALLGVSEAAIGAAINKIEDEFRISVLIRQPGRGLTLTPAGREFLTLAQKLLRDAEHLETRASQLSQHLAGPIDVACFFPAAPYVMPQLIADMAQRYPAISINLFEGDLYEVIQRLDEGSADIALTYNLVSHERIAFEPLFTVPLRAVVSATDPIAAEPDASLVALARKPFIMLDLPGSREWFLSHFARYGIETKIRFRTRSAEMVRSLVAQGQGYSLLGFRTQDEGPPDGPRVSYLPLREPLPVAEFGLASPGHSQRTRAVDMFARRARVVLEPLARALMQDQT